MTLAQALLAVSTRHSSGTETRSVDHALSTIVGIACGKGSEAMAVRKFLGALAQPRIEPEFEKSEVDAMGPLAVGALVYVLEGILDGTCTQEKLEYAFRPIFLVAVK